MEKIKFRILVKWKTSKLSHSDSKGVGGFSEANKIWGMFPGSDLEADPVSWSVTTSISGLRSAACVCSVSVTTFNKLTETPTALHQDDYIQIKLCVDSFSFSWLNLVSHLHLLFTLKKAAVGLNGRLALETGLSRTAEPSHRPAGSAFSIDYPVFLVSCFLEVQTVWAVQASVNIYNDQQICCFHGHSACSTAEDLKENLMSCWLKIWCVSLNIIWLNLL